MKTYTIAFDLDNTLCNSIRRYHPEDILKVKPRKKMLEIINKLKGRGHKIIIFTRRETSGKNARELTKQWLEKYKIPYDILVTNKPHFDILIDDRVWNPHQSRFTNAISIESKCQDIIQSIKKHTYKPKRKK